MSKLKCIAVGKGFEEFFSEGKVYFSDIEWGVTDNDSFDDTDYSWQVEDDGETVMSAYGDETSQLVAKFNRVEE